MKLLAKIFSGLGLAVCTLATMLGFMDPYPSGSRWGWGAGAVAFLVLAVRAYRVKDSLPDFLTAAGLKFFDRDGFCFTFGLSAPDGQMALTILFQNRYSNPCEAEILLRPSADSALIGLSMLRVKVPCDAAGTGRLTVPWTVHPEFCGRKINCLVAADVRYRFGRGEQVRFTTGTGVGPIEDALGLELFQLLKSPARFEFAIPIGIVESRQPPRKTDAAAPGEARPNPENVAGSTGLAGTSPITLAKSEFKLSGIRTMTVICEACGHSYGYEMTREGSGTGEDADQEVARGKAEIQARNELDKQLADGADVVPCPACGSLTLRMRAEKKKNRLSGAAATLFGVVIAVIGWGICWGVQLISHATGRLFFVIGIIGILVIVGGLWIALAGICQWLTGGTFELPGWPSKRPPK